MTSHIARMLRFIRPTTLLLASVSVCNLAGCKQSTDLAAIATMGATAEQSRSAFSSIADDFYESCVRMVGWQRAADPSAFPTVFTSCDEQHRAASQWENANNVVLAYVESLSALATNADQGDYGLAKLADSLTSTGLTPFLKTSAEHDAVVKAAASVVNDYFAFKRREALATIMPQADADFAQIVTTLESAAQNNYSTQLTSERLAIRLFFEPNIARARPGIERLYAFQFRATERSEQGAVDNRQAAIANYVAALESLHKTHHKIVEAIKNNNTSSIAAIVRGYVAEYQPEYTALQKAFQEGRK